MIKQLPHRYRKILLYNDLFIYCNTEEQEIRQHCSTMWTMRFYDMIQLYIVSIEPGDTNRKCPMNLKENLFFRM